MPLPTERSDDSALIVRSSDVAPGWETWALFLADLHWDSVYCDRALLKRHLEQAKAKDAHVFLIGDTFDAMQGPGDRRSSKRELRPELKVPNYIDALVDGAVEWFSPYAENIVMVAEGNHEWAAEKYHETNLAARLARALGAHHFHEWGFVRWQFQGPQLSKRTSKTLYFHHGSGGGGEVTMGVINTNRRQVAVEADIFASGHIHEQWLVKKRRVKMTASGRTAKDNVIHCQMGTYKDEFAATGYHTQTGRWPRPMGGWWLQFLYDSRMPGNVGLLPMWTD